MKKSNPRQSKCKIGAGIYILLAIIITCLILTTSQVSAQGKRISLADLAKLVKLRDPQISPDGKQIVLEVSRQNLKDNRYDKELVLVDISTGARRVLTYDRPNVGRPRWSPSGDRLSFLSIGKNEKSQIFIMPFNGGDAKQITNHPSGVGSYAWSPNGKDIAFVAKDEAEKKEGEGKFNKSFEAGDHSYMLKSRALPSHLWLTSADGDDDVRLTSGTEPVSSIDWSPDGKYIVFGSEPAPFKYFEKVIKIIDIKTKKQRVLVAKPAGSSSPRFSPDGKFIAYTRSAGPEIIFNPAAVYMTPVAGGEEVLMSKEVDRSLSCYWMPDGKSMLFSGTDLTKKSLWLAPKGKKPRKIETGKIYPVSGISIGTNGALVFIGVETQLPDELYYMASTKSRPKKLTDFNNEVASRNLGHVETINWQGPDGFEENGVLIFPPDYNKNRKYPLVLTIHGGPMSVSTESFNVKNQMMAAKDWIIFSPNYRGSSNQGRKFQRAVINDAGDGPGRDVMSGIEAVKSKYMIDDKRIAVSGWSYGGYMTVWLTAHYDVWAAAVAGAAVTDWFDWYCLADYNVWCGFGLGGSPYLNDNAKNYWDQSPIKYAHNIRTPTLILSDVGDARVTVTQSYKLYHALKDNGVEVEFIVYPVDGHSPSDPIHQRDISKRWIEWIEQHFEMASSRSDK